MNFIFLLILLFVGGNSARKNKKVFNKNFGIAYGFFVFFCILIPMVQVDKMAQSGASSIWIPAIVYSLFFALWGAIFYFIGYGAIALFKKIRKPHEKSKVEETKVEKNTATEASNQVKKETPNDSKALSTLYGVPLSDVAKTFEITEGCSSRYDGQKLIVRGDFSQVDTEIEVVVPEGTVNPEIKALILTKTPVEIDEEISIEQMAEMNAFAVGGALYKENGEFNVGSRINWYSHDNAWEDVQRVMVSIAAYTGSFAILEGWKKYQKKEWPTTEPSEWTSFDFGRLKDQMEKYLFCNSDSKGFTGEIVLAGKGCSAMDGAYTALMRIENYVHPLLGTGISCHLLMPTVFKSLEELAEHANRLNTLEMGDANEAYHFGAWGTRDGRTLGYFTFLANNMKGGNSLFFNWPFILATRAKWAYTQLEIT